MEMFAKGYKACCRILADEDDFDQELVDLARAAGSDYSVIDLDEAYQRLFHDGTGGYAGLNVLCHQSAANNLEKSRVESPGCVFGEMLSSPRGIQDSSWTLLVVDSDATNLMTRHVPVSDDPYVVTIDGVKLPDDEEGRREKLLVWLHMALVAREFAEIEMLH
ncbi:hypothetical protein [Stenotrophomonas maltophilia]|uniref:hypothetical protein n=1 Tax=Stenotrophomonas maltophilia TaxID=40324 RepID=UPI0013DA36AE|nr:hypothetical protein [Stenotrophomonas maltophilia]